MERRWQTLLSTEEQARRAVHQHGGVPDSDERLRRWWLSVHDALWEYLRIVAVDREAPEPPPVGMLELVARIAKDLAAGRVPDIVKQSAKRGRPGPSYGENRDILIAVAYMRAAGPDGLEHQGDRIRIKDPDPVERIHLWYGAAKRTIREWRQKLEPDSRSLGANHINGEILTSLTWTAAQRYREAGRTFNAIDKRSAKRTPHGG
jgi:hypothetical protein